MTDTPDDYAIDPADSGLADELANFDPLQTPSSSVIVGNVVLPPLSVNGLPPHMADPIRAAMMKEPVESRPAIEQRMVKAVLEQNKMEMLVRAGPGRGATEYERETCAILGEIHSLNTERDRLERELVEVERWITVFDPVTGLATPKAIDRIQGERRAGWEQRIRQIDHYVAQLQGPEGEHRKKKALFNSVKTAREAEHALEDAAEIKARVEAMVREDRIAKRVEARFKMTKGL